MNDPTDPTRRALRLLALLQQRAAWPGETLAQRLGVSTRTLRRDIARHGESVAEFETLPKIASRTAKSGRTVYDVAE